MKSVEPFDWAVKRTNPRPAVRRERWWLRSKYGLNQVKLDKLIADQKGKCAICETPFLKSPKSRTPHVDHCHDSGLIRGILCQSCNFAVGHLYDNIEIAIRLVKYLAKHCSDKNRATCVEILARLKNKV